MRDTLASRHAVAAFSSDSTFTGSRRSSACRCLPDRPRLHLPVICPVPPGLVPAVPPPPPPNLRRPQPRAILDQLVLIELLPRATEERSSNELEAYSLHRASGPYE